VAHPTKKNKIEKIKNLIENAIEISSRLI
jgi:hypothetical protein